MKQLVICEKPSVAKDVAKALEGAHRFTKTPWGFSSATMLVAAAAGHLVAELEPERYDDRWKEWNYDDLPMLPEPFRYKPRDKNASGRLRTLAELIRDPEVTELVNACDAGREGELIFKLILQYARLSAPKPVLRAWFSSMTSAAIQAAFANLRPDREMIPLESSARSRSEADWYVGMNATRAATLKLGGRSGVLSMGRVQTPTLALIVRRDLEIESFVVSDYFGVSARFDAAAGSYTGTWRASREQGAVDRFEDRAAADALAARVRAARGARVADIEVREEIAKPPKLFDLNDLQREANRRYGMTAAKTLEAAQACYDEHKVLSYPRTDSRYLTTDMAPEVAKFVAAAAAADPAYAPLAAAVNAAGCDPTPIIDDKKVNDHHGLVPTDARHDLSKLTVDQRRVYDLVARRLFAALLAPQRTERTTVWSEVDCDGDHGAAVTVWFRTVGRRVLDEGWKVALPPAEATGKKAAKVEPEEGEEDDEATEVPELHQGEPLRVAEVSVTEHQTSPPPRFSEATLLGAMATAGRLVDDDEMAEAMKESGLGTPATRAATLERLLKVGYIERAGRQLRATDKGRGLVVALGEHPLTLPDLTGGWERRLRLMERTDHDDALAMRDQFVRDVRDFAAEIVAGFADATPDQMDAGRRKLADCPAPACAGSVVEGKRGWGCTTYRSKEEPGCGLVIWKEQGAKKLTEKDLQRRLADIRDGKAEVPKPVERQVIAPCPSDGCDGEIVARPKSYGCTSWKGTKTPGCGYILWRTNPDGGELTEDAARDLIVRGETNGRPAPEVFAECPRCGDKGGKILERPKSYSCNSWKSPRSPGCSTTVWKVQAGHELSEDEVRTQLDAMVGTKAEKPKRKKATGRR